MSDVLMLALVLAAFAAAVAYAPLCHQLLAAPTCPMRTTDDLDRLAADHPVHGRCRYHGTAAWRLHVRVFTGQAGDCVGRFLSWSSAASIGLPELIRYSRTRMVRLCAGAARLQCDGELWRSMRSCGSRVCCL